MLGAVKVQANPEFIAATRLVELNRDDTFDILGAMSDVINANQVDIEAVVAKNKLATEKEIVALKEGLDLLKNRPQSIVDMSDDDAKALVEGVFKLPEIADMVGDLSFGGSTLKSVLYNLSNPPIAKDVTPTFGADDQVNGYIVDYDTGEKAIFLLSKHVSDDGNRITDTYTCADWFGVQAQTVVKYRYTGRTLVLGRGKNSVTKRAPNGWNNDGYSSLVISLTNGLAAAVPFNVDLNGNGYVGFNHHNVAPVVADAHVALVKNSLWFYDVLSNVTDANGDPLNIISASIDYNGNGVDNGLHLGVLTTVTTDAGVAIGDIIVSSGGDVSFQPAPDYVGSVPALTYTVGDNHGANSTGKLIFSAIV